MNSIVSNIWAVVPTYDRGELAFQTLERLLTQTVPPAGILLVDDCSPQHIGREASRRFGKRITVLRLVENLGPAGAFSAGIQMAMECGADWVWLLDDDSWPLPTALEKLMCSVAFSAKDTVALSSLKQDPTGNLEKWEARMKIGFRTPEEDEYRRPEFEVDVVPFAGLLVRSAALARAGLPDVRYFGRFADFELCLRLRRQGRIFCVSESRLVHEDNGWRGTRDVNGHRRPDMPLFLRMCLGYRNLAHYFAREDPAVLPFLQVVSHFGRMAGGILLWDDSKAFRLRMLGRAFFDGLRGRLGPFSTA